MCYFDSCEYETFFFYTETIRCLTMETNCPPEDFLFKVFPAKINAAVHFYPIMQIIKFTQVSHCELLGCLPCQKDFSPVHGNSMPSAR